jgi:4-hydroxybenzoate polyprenyltransferase
MDATYLKKVFTHGSLMVGFVAMAMIYASSSLLGHETSPLIYSAGFMIFFSCYLLNRILEKKQDSVQHKSRSSFISRYFDYLVIVSVVSYVTGVGMIYLVDASLVPISLIPIAFVIFYTVSIQIGGRRLRRIKDITVMKNLGAALAWTSFVVLLVGLSSGGDLTFTMLVAGIFFTSRIFINTVVFDIRDHDGDRFNKVHTIPVKYGPKFATVLVLALNGAIGAFLLYATLAGWIGPIGHLANISTVYTFFYMFLLHTKPHHKNAICDFIVDGEYFAVAGFVLPGTL